MTSLMFRTTGSWLQTKVHNVSFRGNCSAICSGLLCRRLSGYKNIWGGQANEVQVEAKMQKSVPNAITSENWRLDWEEDRRWVEWRLDKEFQSEGEQHRVQLEWTRFRQERGRDLSSVWDDGTFKKAGFDRGSESWWRQKHYDQEFVGSNGVQSMAAVQRALNILEVSDAGDASAIRGAYLRMVNRWHPDRFQKEEERRNAADKFRDVTEAYNLLREFR